MLNIYKYHTHPEVFSLYEKAMECIPDIFWEKYKDNPEELKKREGAIAKSAKYSYLYALYVLRNRFEAGEKAITTDAWYSYKYALYVLRNRFEAGEEKILNSIWKQKYLDFLKKKGIKI